MSIRKYKTIIGRKKFIEEKVGLKLPSIGIYPKNLETAGCRNCENMIGATQIPLGIAGPVKIMGKFARGEYYLPLATTEGALVASVSRGCKAIALSGGAKVYTQNAGISRGAVFKVGNLAAGFSFKKWLDDNFTRIAQRASETSSHLFLKNIFTKIVGKNVFVRFSFDTTDAMGMNMVTIAAEIISKMIEAETKVECLALAGNFDIDKKPAWLNSILGRGRQVWAEVIVPFAIVREVLKTTPDKIHEVATQKCLVGSAISGSLGFNSHFANIIAAIFIATGQDVAHTVEGSLGITTTEIIKDSLYISIYLPDLPIGTVGGGTALPSQREAFAILGIGGGGRGEKTGKFAEIIGGAVLAGELSLLSSLAEGSLASSHQRLARNKLFKAK